MPSSSKMHTGDMHQGVWRFAGCEFDTLRYELRVGGEAVEMERRPLDLLRYLLLKQGEVARKEELLEAVWPGVLVVDASLATAVSKLRKALGEQEVIQTVPRVGYRIAVPVTCVARQQNAHAAPSGQHSPMGSPVEPLTMRGARFPLTVLWASLAVVAVASIILLANRNRSHAAEQPPTVAILPFQNVSGSAGLDYLRSAVPDEVARTLAVARGLALRPLADSARFSVSGVDFRKVGHELDVNRVVTGHFLVAGDQLRVTMEAVDADQDRIVWHDSFDVPSSNLLALQGQIAAIAHGGLAKALGVKEFVTEVTPHSTNEQAYELYLKSVALSYDPNPNKQAIGLLRSAVLLDPNYAPAWDMLCHRYYTDARFGGGGPQMLAFSDAAAEKELALSPTSLEPLAEMTIHRTERGDLVKAHQIALELLRRRPDDPNLHHVLSYVLRYGGSLDEAGRECELTVLLATKVVWGSCSTTFMELGNYNRSMDFVRKDLSSEWSKAHAIEVLLRAGKTDVATRISAPQIPHWDSYKMLLACARHASESEIKTLASKVEVDDDPEVDYFFAGHLAYCGQTDGALRMLKIAINHNYCSYPAMDKDPFFNGLRGNSQFQKLRQSGLACHEAFVNNRETQPLATTKPKL